MTVKRPEDTLFGGFPYDIRLCLDNNEYQINSNVARDKIYSYLIEVMNPDAMVHTGTQCSDSARHTDKPSVTEFNHNISSVILLIQ